MHTLRTILVCLAFAAADMAMPAVPNALEVIDEVDESEFHAARRGAHGRRLRLPAPRTPDHVRIAPSPTRSPRLAPSRPAAHRSLRKAPPAASSDPAPAIEDQP